MVERTKILKIKLGMSDPRGILIPKGVSDILTCEISDEVAVFYFKNSTITKRFAALEIELEKEKGIDDTQWIERVGKAITKYPGKTKEEIRDLLLEQFKQMNLKTKLR